MYYVDLKPGPDNKLIYNTKYLLNCRITFEVPRSNRKLPQCATCQRYGHIPRFYFRKPRYVKCAEEHSMVCCLRKSRSENVKYVQYNDNHLVDVFYNFLMSLANLSFCAYFLLYIILAQRQHNDNGTLVRLQNRSTVNYKESAVYKDLRKARFPALRTRILPGVLEKAKSQPSYATVAG